ncbi:MAG: DNA adenine methylase [Holophagales bacterium]|jgi:DNA adenine methylase|nr:DNA adenine methylase [Holophagales bacterium]
MIVNVASIPLRSPFRYPGGKTWLIPWIRTWLKSFSTKPEYFVEPFLGGGIVSLTVAFENLAEQIIMMEIDPNVAAVWETILGKDIDWLCDRILSFNLTTETAKEVIMKPAITTKELAFRTILKNRINHGGILADGSSFINKGEKGKGIKSRWYPSTLCQRIQDIKLIKNILIFKQGNGLNYLNEIMSQKNMAIFLDPPYTVCGKKPGSRLYKYNELDHKLLFEITAQTKSAFLMTYDNNIEVSDLANKYKFDTELVLMKSTHHREIYELLISKNLDWCRNNDSQEIPLITEDLYQIEPLEKPLFCNFNGVEELRHNEAGRSFGAEAGMKGANKNEVLQLPQILSTL